MNTDPPRETRKGPPPRLEAFARDAFSCRWRGPEDDLHSSWTLEYRNYGEHLYPRHRRDAARPRRSHRDGAWRGCFERDRLTRGGGVLPASVPQRCRTRLKATKKPHGYAVLDLAPAGVEVSRSGPGKSRPLLNSPKNKGFRGPWLRSDTAQIGPFRTHLLHGRCTLALDMPMEPSASA